MEALNAVGLNPLSVLSDRRKQPRKFPSLPTISACKVTNFSSFSNRKQALQERLSRGLHEGLFLATSSVVNGGVARALTYEEALGKSLSAPSSGDFDANGFVDSVISFATENPAILAGGVAVLVVPLVLFQVLKKPKPWGVESAKNAYAKLGADGNAQLLDVRAPIEIRQVGTPDVGGLRKKPVSIAYKSDDKPGFLKKISLKFKEPENTTLFILDKFDGNSELVAELVTFNGFKAAYAIKDGAEGPRGWMNSGLPWIAPRKALSLDFGNLTDAITDAIGDTSDGLAVTLGIAAATGLGLLAFSEIETILQLVGSAALVQFASKKLLFAEDRRQTLQQVDEFLNTKVAPKELVDEIQEIGKALLPASTNNKALPVPTEKSPELDAADSTVQKAEATPDSVTESKVDAVAAPEINSVPTTENKAESLPVLPKPLSPYPYYPDYKPPTSPTPSQP
ncbi:rhodanese-like domain-containing protein 4, chloroplastic [Gastrolobium bilobum]|uniref:rhodanese-like domain-containing protein 4, chloroplastic n=1 Tax=Gastrolobium bilobum TaxID=150636 RepID=UPI002AB0E7BE|nr:rhodanese-like domain-containing protein 4, chloroplastic [Gastrolobium bilobum]